MKINNNIDYFSFIVCMVCTWFLFTVNAVRLKNLEKRIDEELKTMREDVTSEIDITFAERSQTFMQGVKEYVEDIFSRFANPIEKEKSEQ